MSNIQQLTSMISALNEKFNQLEQNSKRIFELPENENLNGSSKFAISRPLDLGEITEYTTLNAILEWCIEALQNIENATQVVQMLPPELLSGPRRIKIPTVDGDDVDVPIVWKILGVDYVETAEVIINIPDASEDNYRKDLILGTQGGDAIRMPGFESTEGIIEPIQPENTVVLTTITVFGNTVLDEPSDPIVGSNYITKSSQGWVSVVLNSAVLTFTPTINDKFSLNLTSFTSGHIIPGLNITTLANKIWAGGFFCIRTSGSYPITLEHLGSNGKIRFSFKGEEDFILTEDDGVLFFKLGVIPTTGNAIAYCLNAPSGSSGPTSADQVSYDNTASGLLAETVQEAVDELYDKKLDRVETGSTERVYAVSESNNQSMIPTMEQFVSDTDIISALEAITTDIATISVVGKTMYKGQLYVSDSPAYIYLAYDDNQIIRK